MISLAFLRTLKIKTSSERHLGNSRDQLNLTLLKRELSKKYHPDRNPDDPEAAHNFMLITKAVNCLADEKTKENCERYGNPEGGGSFSVRFESIERN